MGGCPPSCFRPSPGRVRCWRSLRSLRTLTGLSLRTLTVGDTLGLLKGAAARIWLHRFCVLRDVLVLAVVAPVRVNFLALMGRRVGPLNLTDSQKRGILLWARDFRPALKGFRSKDSASLAQVREGDAVASSSPDKTSPILN